MWAFVANAQHIWDEVGESDSDRDKMLLQLEQECLEVYRRKVDHASHARAQLHKDLANAEAEYSALLSALGESPISLCVSSHSHPTCVYPLACWLEYFKEEGSLEQSIQHEH